MRTIWIVMLLGIVGITHAQVPQMINYQGRVTIGGTNFTGTGQFQFALVNDGASQTYWSNGSAVVSVPVTKGLYSVLLGDTNLTNMAALPATVFTNSDVRLRIWFNDGVSGLQQLSPDQRVAAVGYAMMAGNVPDGAITSNKLAVGSVTSAALAPGAVTTVAIANGAVGSVQLANNAVTAANIATGAITSANIASNTITAANMASGAGVVPTGAIVLSQTANNDALTAAGFTPLTEIDASYWAQVAAAASWSPRCNSAVVVFSNKVWVMGGAVGSSSVTNDVWSSSDGTNWTRATPAAPWPPRELSSGVVFNGKMWVMGGNRGSTLYNDVWSSSDGTNWIQVTGAAPWSARYSHHPIVHDGKIWIIGGGTSPNTD